MMKNTIIRSLTAILILMSGITARAWETLPAELDGTMMPYNFSAADSVTPWAGTGLEPVAVSYVGRHGSRYLSSEKKVAPLLKAIDHARNAGTLTSEGEAFASLIDIVCRISEGRWGDLSPLGEAEQDRLGREFCSSMPELSHHVSGLAESSCVPRVVRTMWDFLYPIAALDEANTIATDEGPEFSPLVRFFETDTTYSAYIKSGNWTAVYDRFVRDNISAGPARRLFGDIHGEEGLRKLTLDMYGVLQSFRCTGLPAPTTRWMSEDEYKACWEATNLKRYLTRSLTPLSTEAMRAVTPLLETLIARSDASLRDSGLMKTDMATKQTPVIAQATDLMSSGNDAPGLNANFWFGHAETLLPLVALMDLPGCAVLPAELATVGTEWKDYEITPMAANVMLVLLKDPSGGDIRAAVRLNGRWVEPAGGEGMLPLWSSLRAHWQRRIDQIVR